MAAPTPNELLQWLAENQFLPDPQVQELRAQLPTFADRHALVKELIRRNWLTPYQANQILTDKRQHLVMGQYRLLERIGEGAMGQVFKAWDVRLGRFVAVKRIHKDYLASAKAMDRFRQEMEAAARLHHPHIVLLRNAGEADNGPFMIMDYFEGTNLSQLVKNEGPLPIHLACECVRQAALGLQHAFESGVVHRDIKPGNLLLNRSGPDDAVTVRILDFGLARSVDDRDESRLTQVGRIIGTIDFVSPEQVENAQKADVRSDIYSLGCTLFFLLTAKPPFPGTKIEEKIYGRLLGSVPSLREQRPEVPAGLETVLQRMMARNPEQRYQTPAELAEALQPFAVAPSRSAPVPAARPVLPFAQPVAGTAPGGLPLARPVLGAAVVTPQQPPFGNFDPGPPAAGDSAFSFRDEAPAPGAGETHDDVFGFGGQATAGGVATAPAPGFEQPSAATTRSPRPGSSLGRIGMVAAFAVVVVVTAVVVGMLRGPSAKKASYPGGSLRLTVPATLKIKEGERRLVIVKIERRGFSGPVKVAVKNLPEGVGAGTALIPEKTGSGELAITAAFGSGARTATLKLVASAEELVAEETLELTVVSSRS